jgi:hypothetical protein
VLGTFAGAVLRRTLPAMGVTLVGFTVARFAFQLTARGHLVGPVSADLPLGAFGPREGVSGWIVSSHTVDAAGRAIPGGQLDRLLADACSLGRDDPADAYAQCAHRLGIHDVASWHPASQFWSLQLAESAVFLVLAAVLAVACAWWLRHRTA